MYLNCLLTSRVHIALGGCCLQFNAGLDQSIHQHTLQPNLLILTTLSTNQWFYTTIIDMIVILFPTNNIEIKSSL